MTGFIFSSPEPFHRKHDDLENVIFQLYFSRWQGELRSFNCPGSDLFKFLFEQGATVGPKWTCILTGCFMPIEAISDREAAGMWLRRHDDAKWRISIRGVTLLVSTWNSLYSWDVGRQIYGVWRVWCVWGIVKIWPLLTVKPPQCNINSVLRFRLFRPVLEKRFLCLFIYFFVISSSKKVHIPWEYPDVLAFRPIRIPPAGICAKPLRDSDIQDVIDWDIRTIDRVWHVLQTLNQMKFLCQGDQKPNKKTNDFQMDNLLLKCLGKMDHK